MKATGAQNVTDLVKYGGKLSGVASTAGLVAEIATSKNNAIAENFSDIILGQTTDGKRGALEAGLNAATLGLQVASGPIGLGVATATVGYRTGNVIENKLGIGNKLGEILTGGAATVIAENAKKGIVGLTSREAYESGQIATRKSQLVREANQINEASGYPKINRFLILQKSKEAQERRSSLQGFVPNYALPSWMNTGNLDKVRSALTGADDAQSLVGDIKEGDIGGAAMDLAGPGLDAAKFVTKKAAAKTALGAASLGLDIGEYAVKPLSEKLGIIDYLADRIYNTLYAKPERSNIARAYDAYNTKLGNDLIDPSPEGMKRRKEFLISLNLM